MLYEWADLKARRKEEKKLTPTIEWRDTSKFRPGTIFTSYHGLIFSIEPAGPNGWSYTITGLMNITLFYIEKIYSINKAKALAESVIAELAANSSYVIENEYSKITVTLDDRDGHILTLEPVCK